MNTENFEYLKKNLLNMGFGEKVNAEMEKLIKAKVPEFSLTTEMEYNKKKMEYTLQFKAGDQQDRYFFNRYDALLKHDRDPSKDLMQTLYLNRGQGVTAKEAFNLLEGRSVEKKLYNAEGQAYQAWLKLDLKNTDDRLSHKILKFSEGYGFDLEKTLARYPIRELDNAEQKENLMRSMRKGNAQQVTLEKDGKVLKYFLAAEPQYKTVNAYDQKMQSVKREELAGQEIKHDKSQKQSMKTGQQESTKKQNTPKRKANA